jgi:long-chain acyl-CoA synthetase
LEDRMSASRTELGYPENADLVDTSDVSSVPEAFRRTVERFGDAVAYRTLDDSTRLTWSQVAEKVEQWAGSLASVGVRRGDTVAMMMVNRPEHLIVDLGVIHLGATSTSLYNTLPAEELGYVVTNSGARIVVTEERFTETVRRAVVQHGLDIDVLVVLDVESVEPLEGVEVVTDTQFLSRKPPAGFDFDAVWRAVERKDVCHLIYTSGTTGRPKGVELSHGSALMGTEAYRAAAPLAPGARLLSAFPLAHAAERAMTYFLPAVQGYCVTFCPDIRQLSDYYLAVRPAYVFMTPRSLERFQSAINAQIALEPDAERRVAMQSALDLGVQVITAEQTDGTVDARLLADWEKTAALRKEILALVGLDEVEWAGVGSAPVSLELIAYFQGLGLPAREGWGTTETGASTAIGRLNTPYRLGYAGSAAPGMEIKLAEDGEILVRGPGLMTGYRNQPEETARAIDAEGWFHTGDIGTINELGYVKMVDRKKELIINANGKNMSPVKIESKVKNAGSLIGQIVAVGDSKPYVSALVTLDPDGVEVYRRQHGIDPDVSIENDEGLLAAVQAQIDRANAELAGPEQIRQWALITDEWVPGGDELTPTMKMKRRSIVKKYADVIEEIYQ